MPLDLRIGEAMSAVHGDIVVLGDLQDMPKSKSYIQLVL